MRLELTLPAVLDIEVVMPQTMTYFRVATAIRALPFVRDVTPAIDKMVQGKRHITIRIWINREWEKSEIRPLIQQTINAVLGT